MKKAISLILAAVMCMSLCACGKSAEKETTSNTAETAAAEALAAKQEAACEKADSVLKGLAETSAKMVPTTYESEVKVVDGKKVYVGTWDHPIAEFEGDVERFLESPIQAVKILMPTIETDFSDCDMYAVIYIKMMGEEMHRILDGRLDSTIADKLK